jgi:protein-tyrosine phosphatase
MVAYGVTTVIDLRSESEVASSLPPWSLMGMGWGQDLKADRRWSTNGATPANLHIPLIDDATMLELGEAPNMYERYLIMLERRQAAFGEIFKTLGEAEGTVAFHCFAGKDRTGLVAAMSLALAGVDADAIAADYAETDLQMSSRYEEWLAATSPDKLAEMRDDLRCPPERMISVLDHLDQKWGGAESYLDAAGLSPTVIARLRSKLTESAS